MSRTKRNCNPLRPGSTGTSDPVDVILVFKRKVIIEDMGNSVDIESP